MDDWDEEIDEASLEDADADTDDDGDQTPEEEAFQHGYDAADEIDKEETESADLEDDSAA